MIFNHSWRHFRPFWAVLTQLKKWPKSKGLPLTILVNLGHFLNFLKTLQKQRLNTFESFSTTPDVILGFFERFWTSWKKSQKRPKVKANPYHFGQFWPLFQLSKNTSKTKPKPFWIIFKLSWRHFRPFWAVLNELKKGPKKAKK